VKFFTCGRAMVIMKKSREKSQQMRFFMRTLASVEPVVLPYLGVCRNYILTDVLIKVVSRGYLPHVAFEEV
jgi:hypothetical protein